MCVPSAMLDIEHPNIVPEKINSTKQTIFLSIDTSWQTIKTVKAKPAPNKKPPKSPYIEKGARDTLPNTNIIKLAI